MGDSPWSNQAIALIILTEEATGFSGLFGYSPTVGKDNLVFSVAAAGGTDPYGNVYYADVCTYASWSNGTAGAVSQLADGFIQLGSGTQIPTALGANLAGVGGALAVNSGGTAAADHQSAVTLESQSASSVTHGLIALGAGQVQCGTAGAMTWNDNNGTLGVTGAGVFTGSLSASTITATAGTLSGGTLAIGGATFTQSNLNLDPGMGIPADYPLSQITTAAPTGTVAAWAANVDGVVNACVRMVGTMYTEMTNRGLFA
jgi:hypothetical protein